MMSKSLMYEVSREELKEIIEDSNSIKQVLERIGYKIDTGNNRSTFFKIVKAYSFEKEIEELRERTKSQHYNRLLSLHESLKIPINELFIENSPKNRGVVRNRVLKDKLIPYICSKCGNSGEWQGERLSLQIEHKNGVNNDHRLENLEFLCPNCHSQTKTYAGRNLQGKLKKEERENQKQIRTECRKEAEKKLIQDRKDFLNSINTSQFGWIIKVQDKWGVSHTQVKRWIKKYYPEFKYYERKTGSTTMD